jgi:hypothetical protein
MSWFLAGKEVIKDLGFFLLPKTEPRLAIKAKEEHLPLPVPKPLLNLTAPTLVVKVGEGSLSISVSVLYVAKTKVRLWQRPVVSQDGAFGYLAFGLPLVVSGYEGRFAKVEVDGQTGYVLKDDLVNLREALYPSFNEGEIYASNHPDTKKLRRLINDEFANADLCLPLQAAEFVMYRLAEKKLTLPWGNERPRVVGLWHNLLKGKPGVLMSVTPKTGALMEYQKEDGTGWVGYTKAVLVDETIVIEGVGRIIEGEYKEETFSKAEWHEWRPVWVAVS